MDEQTKQLIHLIAGFAIPVLLSPLAVLTLRPLFAVFLREGLELFTEVSLERPLAHGIAHLMSFTNVALFVLSWVLAYASFAIRHSALLGALIMLVGVLVALAVTTGMVRNRVGVIGRPALLVGLLAFTGGNLPLFLLVPVLLVIF